jgi:hypothetical protein
MAKTPPEVTFTPATHSMNLHLRGGSYLPSPYDLTERGREEKSPRGDVPPGTRVAFVANLGSVLTYKQPPSDQEQGTVILVRTAMGDLTGHPTDQTLYVRWDSGRMLPVRREHLRALQATKKVAGIIRTAGDMNSFLRVAGSEDLIHKATEDLWTVMEKDGEFMIARLFQEDGTPLKA